MKRFLPLLLLIVIFDSVAWPLSKELPEQALAKAEPKASVQVPVETPAIPVDSGRPLPPLPEAYIIGPEDVLQIIVTKEPDLSIRVFVRPDGMISYPQLNDIRASGLTPAELKANITAALSEYVKNPQVSVLVLEIRSSVIFVLGAVNHPGVIPFGGPMTVSELLTRVGGFTEFAQKDKIQILRTDKGKQSRFNFNFNTFSDGRDSTQNIALRSGDMVIVK